MSRYRSIFLERDWVHSKYYGWQDDWPDMDFRVLSRRAGPIQRRLVVSCIEDADRSKALLADVVRRAGRAGDIVFHDLIGGGQRRPQRFRPCPRNSRMLNVDTFVIDLSRSEDELMAKMSQLSRRSIRKAVKAGVQEAAQERPSSTDLKRFLAAYQSIAKERGLRIPVRSILERMFADGRATLVSAILDQTAAYVLTYRAGDSAIFLFGAGSQLQDGAGHLAQWRAIRALKEQGVRWYDLGGVPAADPENGIYRFKSGLGGEFVDLGVEYRLQTPLAKAAAAGLEGLRRVRRFTRT